RCVQKPCCRISPPPQCHRKSSRSSASIWRVLKETGPGGFCCQGRKEVAQVPRQRIKTLVRSLLSKNSIQKPPVPLEVLAKSLDAEIRYSPFEGDFSGMLFRHVDQRIIGVDYLHHPIRNR